jgi:hypothetical protein
MHPPSGKQLHTTLLTRPWHVVQQLEEKHLMMQLLEHAQWYRPNARGYLARSPVVPAKCSISRSGNQLKLERFCVHRGLQFSHHALAATECIIVEAKQFAGLVCLKPRLHDFAFGWRTKVHELSSMIDCSSRYGVTT